MSEFAIIEKYFAPLGRDGFKDDAAVLDIPAGQELVITTDTLNEGTHFWEGEAPEYIAHKALRVNLSDLAAMGAEPLCYQLALAYPLKPEEIWLEKFTGALAADQKEFGIFCSGGDTTSINGPLSISITALGLVPNGEAFTRSGARDSDAIILTGPVGDAWIGLEILRGNLSAADPEYFLQAYKKPRPQTHLAQTIRPYVNAAIDISDGLIADLSHICAASGLSARLDLETLPFSSAAQSLIEAKTVKPEALLTGGDDYQLILAVSSFNLEKLEFPYLHLGYFEKSERAPQILDKGGAPLKFSHTGWQHF